MENITAKTFFKVGCVYAAIDCDEHDDTSFAYGAFKVIDRAARTITVKLGVVNPTENKIHFDYATCKTLKLKTHRAHYIWADGSFEYVRVPIYDSYAVVAATYPRNNTGAPIKQFEN